MDLFSFCSVCFAANAALAARSLALASLSLEEARMLADRRDHPKIGKGTDEILVR